MTRAEKIARIKPVTAWAWAIQNGLDSTGKSWSLCYWAESSKEVLLAHQDRSLQNGGKPSPEAIPVRVLLTPSVNVKHLRPDLVQVDDKSLYPLTLDSYGFSWGPVTVERTASGKRFGIILSIKTKHKVLEVRVSPKGDSLKTTERMVF